MSWMDLKSKGLHNMPGIPEPSYGEIFDTVGKLRTRAGETAPAVDGLSGEYTIGGHKAKARDFLMGGDSGGVSTFVGGASTLRKLSLEDPKQFAMAWTTYKEVYKDAAPHLDAYAGTLTSVPDANAAFWPMIAEHGAAYNLLILRKVTSARFAEYKKLFPPSDLETYFAPIHQQGRLYEIDFSMFEYLGAWHYDDKPPRYNPATLMLLERHPDKLGVFEPKWIRVWSKLGEPQVYSPYFIHQKPGSWLYALQAVKTSVTLYGIWLGHVYHWHMVTAAMQGTWHETIPDEHPIHKLLAPHLNYLVTFDYVLLDGAPFPLNQFVYFAAIAPPSRIADTPSFLKLTDTFAAGREFFDDDPKNELARNGLRETDFTVKEPWDCYPIAQKLLKIWDICERFITTVVSESYRDDHAVAADKALQNWMTESAKPDKGNIRGLPVMNNRAALTRVLTSLLYRITAHGMSRLNSTANPALTFVANFPPCLQSEVAPSLAQDLTTRELLTYLPNTGTIGDMLKFYFAFVFSTPYVPLIPPGKTPGSTAVGFDLYFGGDILTDPRNAALWHYRDEMLKLMGPPNAGQWPRNIET